MGTYEKINDFLLKWFLSIRRNSIPINSPILLRKALDFAKAFNYGNFKASNGWLKDCQEKLINAFQSDFQQF